MEWTGLEDVYAVRYRFAGAFIPGRAFGNDAGNACFAGVGLQ